jgi:hypothetical protein
MTTETLVISGTVTYQQERRADVVVRWGLIGDRTLLLPADEVRNALRRVAERYRLPEHCPKLLVAGTRTQRRFFDAEGLVTFLGYCHRTHSVQTERFADFLRGLERPLVPGLPAVLTTTTTRENDIVWAVARACHRFPSLPQHRVTGTRRTLDLFFPGELVAVECDEAETHRRKADDDAVREKQVLEALPGCVFLRFVPERDDPFVFIGDVLHELYLRSARGAAVQWEGRKNRDCRTAVCRKTRRDARRWLLAGFSSVGWCKV